LIRKANQNDRELVVSILWQAFKENKSVNYIAGKEEKSIRFLIEYSFERCIESGEVFISTDLKAVAMIQFQDQKKFTWKGIISDLKLILNTIGWTNIPKTLARESFIKKHYPKSPFTYLWYIGVDPKVQGNGLGTQLLKHVLFYSKTLKRPVYLETTLGKNINWYLKHGFKIYSKSDRFGFPLNFLRTE
tara:strand:+ start:1095 stop:1661 length:567 start_codon:yes stop_codon:yes gene_type:complete